MKRALPKSIDPQEAGVSAERLQRVERHLKENYVDRGRLPGTQLLIYRRGHIVHDEVQGFADIERHLSVTTDTIFRIHSMTKPITTVGFMMLVEEGRVALDEPVSKYIPGWANLGVYAGGIWPRFQTTPTARPMLIIDLLRHTSGLTYGFQQRTNVDAAYRTRSVGTPGSEATLQSMVDQLAGIPLEFSPGEAWNYSVSTDVVGHIIECITGETLEVYLKEKILDPLMMEDTSFFVPADKAKRFAACYAASDDGGMSLQDDPQRSAYLSPPSYFSGGGGLCSTAHDYLRFCLNLAGWDKSTSPLLAPKTLALMKRNHLPNGCDLTELSRSMFSEASYAGIGFGLGFSVTMDPAKSLIPGSVGEYSWGGAATTTFWVDPLEELVVVFMTQLMPSNAYQVRRELRTMVYAALTEAGI